MDMMDAVGCEWLLTELGPPPDAILRIPPPPLPHFIDRIYHEMAVVSARVTNSGGENETALPCHWCHWARRLDTVGSISVTPGTEMALEDTWFFVILASCLMLTLGALFAGLIYLRVQGKMLKGTWEFGSFLTENGSLCVSSNGVLSTGSECNRDDTVGRSVRNSTNQPGGNKAVDGSETRVSTDNARGISLPQYNGVSLMTPSTTHPTSQPHSTRALWAGVKTCEGNHYTITHAQPVDQKLLRISSLSSTDAVESDQPDEDSAGYTTLHPNAAITAQGAHNKIYYCCTDLMIVQQSTGPGSITQKVTSLDDPAEISSDTKNPLYVNMSALHPLSTPKVHYPLVNPIYPSPHKPQHSSDNKCTQDAYHMTAHCNMYTINCSSSTTSPVYHGTRQHTHQA